MVEGCAAHAQVPIVQQDFTAVGGLADPVAPEGIANAGGGCPQDPFQVIAQRIGSVEIDPGAAARQPQAGQQPRQAKDMVSMHVGDEDPPQLGNPEVTAQKLVLGALTTVKQPELGPLRQAHGHRRNVATPGGNAGAGAEKGDLHVSAAQGAHVATGHGNQGPWGAQ